jgi:hypothetical protein
MARSTIFGYTIETEDGKLVITLTGSMAESLVGKYTAEGIEQNPRLLASLLPFAELGSRSVLLRPNTPLQEKRTSHRPDLKEIFGQGFDRSQTEFETQLEEYRSLLEAGEFGNKPTGRQNAASSTGPRKRAPRKRRR